MQNEHIIYTCLQQNKHACSDAWYQVHEVLSLTFQFSVEWPHPNKTEYSFSHKMKLYLLAMNTLDVITNLFLTLNTLKNISHIFIFQQQKFLFSILICSRPNKTYGTIKIETQGRSNLTIANLGGRGTAMYILWPMNSTNSLTVDHLKVELIWVPECCLLPQFLQSIRKNKDLRL